ncbi:flagellar basal-body rod protein FlgG [Desulfonatronum thiosulfatophilum]|uniref:Flagellar basal-body rod protein FlgG n=2 Tax=Desulfonatronum thiosulfatophilum TaxID=617002 RepID=A0A1G6DIF9_9BACT|nr:flagellar basal-body rod protein FlgG [Desulfonatronum thiosulfatophilum]
MLKAWGFVKPAFWKNWLGICFTRNSGGTAMQTSMYNALFGALTQEHRLANTANNLANVNTTGYKGETLAFQDVFARLGHDMLDPISAINEKSLLPVPDEMAQTRISLSHIDFSQGTIRETGNPLDVALSGEGFFKVRPLEGDFYTRNGNFRLTPNGQLVTGQGFPVLVNGGPVNIEPGARVVIGPAGDIQANGEPIGNMDLVTFENLQVLEKLGQNMFRIRPGVQAAEMPAGNVTVAQGYLESANVEVVKEMVNMIDAHRTFEAYQKVMHTTQEADQKLIREVASPR